MPRGDLAALLHFPGADEEATPEPPTADLPAIPADDGSALHAVPLPGSQMTYGRQAAEALVHAVRTGRLRWREEKRREGSHLRRARTASWSIQDTIDYADGRPWVPEGHDGGIAEKAGRAYFLLIGIPGVHYAAWLRWKFDKPLRWLIWTAVRFAVAMAVLTLLGHGRLAAEITGAVLAVAGISAAVIMPRRPGAGDDTEEEHAEEEDMS